MKSPLNFGSHPDSSWRSAPFRDYISGFDRDYISFSGLNTVHIPVTCCLLDLISVSETSHSTRCAIAPTPSLDRRPRRSARYLPEPTMSRARRPTRSAPTVDRSARWARARAWAPGPGREHVLSAPRRSDHPGAVPMESLAVGRTDG